MSPQPQPAAILFATDDQLAGLRPVHGRLQQLGESNLAAAVADVIEILDPPAREATT